MGGEPRHVERHHHSETLAPPRHDAQAHPRHRLRAATVRARGDVVEPGRDATRRAARLSYDVSGDSLASGPLALSDLVIGAASQRLVWDNHGAKITLAPLDAVNHSEPLSLYYQIRSDVARPKATTNVALYRIQDGRVADSAALQVVLASPLPAGISEAAPLVDVSRLPRGSYRLELHVTDGALVVRRGTVLPVE